MRRADAELVDARLLRYHGAGPRHPGPLASARDLEEWDERTARSREVQQAESDRLDRAEEPEPVVLAPWAEPLATWDDERRDAFLARLCRAEGIDRDEALRRWRVVVSG